MESYIPPFKILFVICSLYSSVLEISCTNISDSLPICNRSLLGLPCPGCQGMCIKVPCDSQPVCKLQGNGKSVCTAGCHGGHDCPLGYLNEGFSPSGANFDVYILELIDILRYILLVLLLFPKMD